MGGGSEGDIGDEDEGSSAGTIGAWNALTFSVTGEPAVERSARVDVGTRVPVCETAVWSVDSVPSLVTIWLCG